MLNRSATAAAFPFGLLMADATAFRARLMAGRNLSGLYRPDFSISSVMHAALSDRHAPWCTCDRAGTRSRTMRLASARFGARKDSDSVRFKRGREWATRSFTAGAVNSRLSVLMGYTSLMRQSS
jgi:hypothetical protein